MAEPNPRCRLAALLVFHCAWLLVFRARIIGCADQQKRWAVLRNRLRSRGRDGQRGSDGELDILDPIVWSRRGRRQSLEIQTVQWSIRNDDDAAAFRDL